MVLPAHRWDVAVGWARRAEWLGLASVWLVDRNPSEQAAGGEAGLEPLTALAALARVTPRLRLGGLLGVSRRPPAVAAKALATTDLLSGGRLVVAMTKGSEEPASSSVGPEGLGEAVQILHGAFGGGPFTFEGRHYRVEALRCRPRPRQRPHPPVWVVGGREVLDVAAGHGDGWAHDAWSGTVEAYRRLGAALDRACERLGRDPASLPRAVYRSALVGESEADLRRRWEQSRGSPSLDEQRQTSLVGTPDEVRGQVAAWETAGVAALIVDPGALAWSGTSVDELDLLASAVT